MTVTIKFEVILEFDKAPPVIEQVEEDLQFTMGECSVEKGVDDDSASITRILSVRAIRPGRPKGKLVNLLLNKITIQEMYKTDHELSAEQLEAKYGDTPLKEYPRISRMAWKSAVGNNSTLLGYWTWVVMLIDKTVKDAGW